MSWVPAITKLEGGFGAQKVREVVSVALNDRQKRFVEEYLVDLNATQAAIRAGYKEKNARAMGAENLTKPDIAAAIQRAMAERQKRTEITQDMIVAELAKVAFANGTDFAKVVCREVPVTAVDEDGEIKTVMKRTQLVEVNDTSAIPPEKRAAISGIKEGKYGIEVSSYDKVRALELLGKHLGMFDSKSAQKPDTESNLLDRLIAGTEGDIDTDDLPEVE